MRITRAAGKQSWYALPLDKNPKAILPLYFAGFGSLCWLPVALFWSFLDTPAQSNFWIALIIVGLVSMAGGLVGSLVYRHYRVAAFALIVALVSPPVWLWLCLGLPPGKAYDCLPPGMAYEYVSGFRAVLWLYCELPLLLFALWRSPWRRWIKAVATVLAVGGLAGLFTVHTLQARRELSTALHVSNRDLALAYAKNDQAAIKRLRHKRVVVTGALYGAKDGLLGGHGPYRMHGDIEFDDLVGNDTVADGQSVSIIATCEGIDFFGEIHLANSRVIK